ncbi:MAG TPA: endo-1,3-alpha-glucanase family glycosylhydrolase, partial [Armatimonadota bacterium]
MRFLCLAILAMLCLSGAVISAPAIEDLSSYLPCDMPSTASLRQSEKKVFLINFSQFPAQVDNKPMAQSYYTTQWLNPDGEAKHWKPGGGVLRQVPLLPLITLHTGPDWADRSAEDEVRAVSALGIDGMVLDILVNSNHQMYHWDRINRLIRIAPNVDPNFKFIFMPEVFDDALSDTIKHFAKYPAAYHLPDGRLVVMPYMPTTKPVAWWKDWLASMKADGYDIAFFPCFQGWQNAAKDYAAISYGFTDWGPRDAVGANALLSIPTKVHQGYGVKWAAPIAPQDVRQKYATGMYWESSNTEAFRNLWMSAITGGADWIDGITWSDYGEATEIAPSTGTQYGFYDLFAYYNVWFKTGVQPKIVRDVLYYCYRIMPTDATFDPTLQTGG